MNCDGKMSFGAFVFPVNPYLIRISHSRTVVEQKSPYRENLTDDLGVNGRTISGEGEFYGENCMETFDSLRRVFEQGGSDILYVPSQMPVVAMFVSLELTGRDISGVLGYRFTFAEAAGRLPDRILTRKTADGKHCLWDYAYESGLPVETLIALNPDISRPDKPVPAGRSVNFC